MSTKNHTIQDAFNLGKQYRKENRFAVSPYYNQSLLLDKYFYAGFDGKKFEEVEPEKHKPQVTEPQAVTDTQNAIDALTMAAHIT